MVEAALTACLSTDSGLRDSAQSYLTGLEQTAGFMPCLMDLIESCTNTVTRLQAVMLLKNMIERNWQVPMSKAKSLPCEDKEAVMQYLIRKVYYAPDADQQMQSYVHLCLLSVAKTELERWGLLHDLLAASLTAEVTEPILRLTYDILRQQMKKRMTRQKLVFKTLAERLLPPLLALSANYHHVLIDKLMLVLMTATPHIEMINACIAKASSKLETNDYAYTLELIKGLGNVSHICPQASVSLARLFYSVMVCVPNESELTLRLLQRASKAFEILLKTTSEVEMSPAELQTLFEKVLRLLSTGEQWELWIEGNYEGFVMQDEPPEDSDSFGGLMYTLMALHPQPVEGYLLQLLAELPRFDTALKHSILLAAGILPSSFSDVKSEVVTLKTVVIAVEMLQLEGFELAVVLKDTAWLLRKWLSIEEDPETIMNLLIMLNFRATDPVVKYECCLTAKQLLIARPIESYADLLLRELSPGIIACLQVLSIPKVLWHLVELTRLLVKHKGFSEADMFALDDAGSQILVNSDSEHVVLGVKRIIEGMLTSANTA